MRKLIQLTMIGLVLGGPISAFAKTIDISVNGMVCGFCAQGIEKKLKALNEVESVNVSLESKVVKITTKGDKDIPDAKLNEILKSAGYNVAKIQR